MNLQQKKLEVSAAWQEYITADEQAINNREVVRGARAAIFQAFHSGNANVQEYLLVCVAAKEQAELERKAIELGKIFDKRSDELGTMLIAAGQFLER